MKFKFLTVLIIIFITLTSFVQATDTNDKPYYIKTLADYDFSEHDSYDDYDVYYNYRHITFSDDVIYYIPDYNESIYSVNTITYEKNKIFEIGTTLNYDNKTYSTDKILYFL